MSSSLNLDTDSDCIAPTDPTPVSMLQIHFQLNANSFSSSYGQITTPLINLNTLFTLIKSSTEFTKSELFRK
jgi:hypothetical protein